MILLLRYYGSMLNDLIVMKTFECLSFNSFLVDLMIPVWLYATGFFSIFSRCSTQNLTSFQAAIRGMIVRDRLREAYDAALIIQRNWKRFKMERKYQQIRRAVVAIQAHYRGACARRRYFLLPRLVRIVSLIPVLLLYNIFASHLTSSLTIEA